MKKPNIPATNGQATPVFVRAVQDNLEIITGRRGNKLSLPDLQTLPSSATPTQAECQALNAYVNEWAKSVAALIERLDDTGFVTIDTGKVGVIGTIARTDGNDTLNAVGLVTVTGTLARTEGADNSISSGSVGGPGGELGDDELNGFQLNGE